MANRLDYYFRQKVSESELDLGFNYLEVADRALVTDQGKTGVLSGCGVAAQGTPNMTVAVASGVAYDPLGERCQVPTTQNVDCSQDYNAVSTAVAGGGNQKWLSLFLMFDRLLTDPRTDGNSLTVYFSRAETYKFKLVQGAEATAGAAVRPALDPNGTLLADILLSFGTTTVTNGIIDTTRRQDAIVASGSPRSVRRGITQDAVGDLLSYYNNHVTGAADKHAAADINYAGGGTWADSTTNPAASVEAQLDKIVSDLAGTGGAVKVGSAALSAFADGTTNPAGSVGTQLAGIITALISTSSNDGAKKIGAKATGNFSAGTVRSQLDQLDPLIAYKGLVALAPYVQASPDVSTTTSSAGANATPVVGVGTAAIGDTILWFAQLDLDAAGNDMVVFPRVVEGAGTFDQGGQGYATATQVKAASGNYICVTFVGFYVVTGAGTWSVRFRFSNADNTTTVRLRTRSLIAALVR